MNQNQRSSHRLLWVFLALIVMGVLGTLLDGRFRAGTAPVVAAPVADAGEVQGRGTGPVPLASVDIASGLGAAESSRLRIAATGQPGGMEVQPGLARLSVRVKSGRKPVRGAEVSVVQGDREISAMSARTDKRGRVQLDVEPSSRGEICVRSTGAAETVCQAVETPAVGERKSIVVDLGRLPSAHSTRVRVLSYPSGTPLADCRVLAQPSTRVRGGLPIEGRTDSAGFVTLPWMEGGSYTASASGHGPCAVLAPASEGRAKLVIDLPQDAMLFGKLSVRSNSEKGDRSVAHAHSIGCSRLRPGGEPPLSKRQPTRRRPFGLDESSTDSEQSWIRASDGSEISRVDSDGNWEIQRIRFQQIDAPIQLMVEAYEGAESYVLAHSIEVHPGDAIEVQDPHEQGAPLDLQLHYDGDFAWSGRFDVLLRPVDPELHWMAVEVRPTPDGVLRRAMLAPGEWDLLLPQKRPSGLGFASAEERTAENGHLGTFEHRGGEPASLVMRGWVPLRGTVTGIAEDAAPGVWVQARSEQGRRLVEVESSRSFDLSPIPQGAIVKLAVCTSVSYTGRWSEETRVSVLAGNDDNDADVGFGPAYGQPIEIVASGAEVTLDASQ